MWSTTLCLSILRPSRNLLLHRNSRCGQVGIILLFWHSVKYRVGVCLWLEEVFPYGCHILGKSGLEWFRDLCACGVPVLQKWLESLWFISLLDSHSCRQPQQHEPRKNHPRMAHKMYMSTNKLQCQAKLRPNVLSVLGAPNHTPTPLLPALTHTIQFVEFTYCMTHSLNKPSRSNTPNMTH